MASAVAVAGAQLLKQQKKSVDDFATFFLSFSNPFQSAAAFFRHLVFLVEKKIPEF